MFLFSWWRSVIEAELEKKKVESKREDWWTSKPPLPKEEPKSLDQLLSKENVAKPLDSHSKANLALSATWGRSYDPRKEYGDVTSIYQDHYNVQDVIQER